MKDIERVVDDVYSKFDVMEDLFISGDFLVVLDMSFSLQEIKQAGFQKVNAAVSILEICFNETGALDPAVFKIVGGSSRPQIIELYRVI